MHSLFPVLDRVDSNQMRVVDGRQRIYLEWPKCIQHAATVDFFETCY